ncbi:hypothetical protein F4679DRAFT_597153 [Xylaria curta]|nr:hypothetical protein F4679DRAFT_597153 [Xylaria curta]
MPTSQTTTRIPRSEWEDRKSRLLELYLDLELPLSGINGVIETMANEGFVATKPQYEYQFRIWKVRKNMKRLEYERIIQERQHGRGPTSITLGTRVISDARSKRALRRYAGGMPQIVHRNYNSANPEDTVSLVLNDDGRVPAGDLASEAIITTTEHNYTASNRATDLNVDIIAVSQNRPSLELTNESIGVLPSNCNNIAGYHMDFDDPLSLVNFDLPALHGDNFLFDGMSEPVLDVGVEHQQNGTLFDIQYSPYSTASKSLSLSNTSHSHGLSLQRSHWMPPSATITAGLISDICNAAPAPSARNAVLNLCNFTNNFVNDLNSVQRFPADFTLALGTFLSAESLFGEQFMGLLNNISIDVATEARLCSRLITSAINGFTGLGNIPTSGVMVFLSKHRTMSLSMTPLLAFDQSPAATSLGEHIFRAALEQDNVKVIDFILDHSNSIHANDTVCLHYGKRYTPLEIAAKAQSYSAIGLLLDRNVDVNKSFSGSCHSNALDLLLSNRDDRSTIDDLFFSLIDRLLSAQAKISVDFIKRQLSRSADQRLTIPLIENSTPQQLKRLISDNSALRNITKSFEKLDSQRVIQFMIDKCQKIDANLCWHYSILLEAVNQDYEDLAKMLSGMGRHARTKKQAKISFIFHDCPVSDEESEEENSIRPLVSRFRHQGDLAQARSDIIERVASRGPMKVFKTALEEGDLQSARWVLDYNPDLHFANELNFGALENAFAIGFDDLAWKLVTTNLTERSGDLDSLYASVKMRKPEFVRAIIQSGVSFHSELVAWKKSILEAALEWDDDSIINDIWQLRPVPIYPSHSLMKLAVERGRMEIFWGIFEAWNALCAKFACEKWPGAVKLAVESEDLQLLDELIARGATLDGNALKQILMSHAFLKKTILKRYRQACSQGGAVACWHVLWNAVINYPRSSELIDMLFEFGFVTGKSFQVHEYSATLLAGAIGKQEIRSGEEHPRKCLIEKLLVVGSDVNVVMNEAACIDELSRYHSNKVYWGELDLFEWEKETPSLFGTRHPQECPLERAFLIHPVKTTACLLAIETGNTEIVRLLLQKGAEVNEPARFGIMRTPLQKAAELNNVEIITLLLENGAEVNAPPALLGGATALQFTAIHGNCELAMTLLEHGARLDVPPSKGPDGRWPLEGAAENGRLDMIQLLWDANNGPFDDKQCQKAMRLAEYYGHLGCRDLIKKLMAKS